MEIRGRDLINGLPKTVKITSEEIRDALSGAGRCAIVEAVKAVLEKNAARTFGRHYRPGHHHHRRRSTAARPRQVVVRRRLACRPSLPDDPLSCVALGTGSRVRGLRQRMTIESAIDAMEMPVADVAEEVAAIVFAGGTVIIPNDTSYLIGCDPLPL